MKSKEQLLRAFFSRLAELQSGTVTNNALRTRLVTEVLLLSDILGDDVPEEYWDDVEELLYEC